MNDRIFRAVMFMVWGAIGALVFVALTNPLFFTGIATFGCMYLGDHFTLCLSIK